MIYGVHPPVYTTTMQRIILFIFCLVNAENKNSTRVFKTRIFTRLINININDYLNQFLNHDGNIDKCYHFIESPSHRMLKCNIQNEHNYLDVDFLIDKKYIKHRGT